MANDGSGLRRHPARRGARWACAALIVGGSALAGLLGAPACRAQAEVYLEIRKSESFQIPIVVEDFIAADPSAGGAPPTFAGGSSVEGVLTRDLLYSDAMIVVRLPREALLPQTLLLDVRGLPVDRRVQARVRGVLRPRRDGFELEAALLDEGTGKEIFARRYALPADPASGRIDSWGLHHLADEVVFFLTGNRGSAATRIVFVRATQGSKELYLIDWDGEREEPLSALRSILVSPAWHPGGARLACTSYHRGQPVLVAWQLPEGELELISTDPMPTAAAYSPDGKEIAYSSSRDGNAEIYVARADGSRVRRLTVHPAIDTAPSWSPSGRRLVFTSDRTGRPQLFLIDADGSGLEQLTFGGKWNDSGDWSPRADRIVHVCRIDGEFELALIQADGSGWRRLTVGGGCENPCWAPDGRHVVFARQQAGVRNLWILGVAARSLRQLTRSRDDSYNPAWSRSSKERLRISNQGG